MRRAVSITTVVCLASLTLLSTGCVQQDRYDQLVVTNRTLKEQIVNVQEDRDVANANVATLRGQLTKTKSENDTLRMRINAMDNELGNQESEYGRLLERVSKMPVRPLPYQVERALEELATAYPELLSFSAEAGMIRFASDLTFDLGSIEIKAAAAATITTLADILNAPDATGLEVQVVGHTDNVPIGKPATRQKHPTNVHLSVHRAISVRSALTAAGIDP
ncbi:MAG: OmpA family protein, partial [Phycisphaerales bacterium]